MPQAIAWSRVSQLDGLNTQAGRSSLAAGNHANSVTVLQVG